MLVLSRKAGEKILIGDKIAVTVVRIAPGVVRIGVDAPDNYTIIREELKNNGHKDEASKDKLSKDNGKPQPPRESSVP